ncbi:MAG: zinc ribbon domain-containing protein, partial [Rikenellaceae bacterium]|nr:zinc ribbon domain-containing protein [Rikenellaceae bacterium]
HDPQGGGTNADGSKNEKYCSYCCQNGAFTFNGTAKEMQTLCRKMMQEQGMGKFKAWLFALSIPGLERWRAH